MAEVGHYCPSLLLLTDMFGFPAEERKAVDLVDEVAEPREMFFD